MESSDGMMDTTLDVPLLTLAPDDLAALAEMIRTFLVAMRRKPQPASESDVELCQAAFERLEQLQHRLASEESARTFALRLEDILSLEGALMLFSIFLCLEVPTSEKRETTLEALWEMREQLTHLRHQRFHLN